MAPAVTVPTNDMFFSKEFPDRPDLVFLKEHFFREGRLTEEQAIYILQKATDILRREPTLLEVDAPITGMNGSMVLSEYESINPNPFVVMPR